LEWHGCGLFDSDSDEAVCSHGDGHVEVKVFKVNKLSLDLWLVVRHDDELEGDTFSVLLVLESVGPPAVGRVGLEADLLVVLIREWLTNDLEALKSDLVDVDDESELAIGPHVLSEGD